MEQKPGNMYLTHFGRVRDVERLAADMKSAVEQFAEAGRRLDGREDRSGQIRAWMQGWLMEGARRHGVTHDDRRLEEIFANDVELNAQGIEFWLDHGRG